jgi:aminomethyltransferase
MALKNTAFHEMHLALGAKMVDFAGFAMPVQYTGIIEEHLRVRNAVGVFDVSHMGEVVVRGKDARAFVQKITINDAGRLTDGRVQYSAMCMEDGGIVDDLLVYHRGDHYLLVINAANTPKDLAWMRTHAEGEVEILDESDATSLLAVQGPRTVAVLQPLTDVPLDAIPYYHFRRGRLAGVEMMISRTGYTGEPGFELYFDADPATGARVWKAIMAAGAAHGIGPVGLGARDTLRLEMGYCLYGHDIDGTTNPLEAGLGWITKLDKGDFIGRDALLTVKAAGPARKLVGFTMADRAFPRQGYPLHVGGAPAGRVTSGTHSPVLDKGIGMGYVTAASALPGTAVGVVIRNRESAATITPPPFVHRG